MEGAGLLKRRKGVRVIKTGVTAEQKGGSANKHLDGCVWRRCHGRAAEGRINKGDGVWGF